MAAEIWDLYDGCGEKTGRTMVRGEAIPTGFYHIGVHIWPMNGRGELLIQRRSNSYCYVYAVKTDRMENEFSLQKEEVSAVRWCSPQRLMQMVAEGSMYNYGDAYYKLLLEFQRNNMRA